MSPSIESILNLCDSISQTQDVVHPSKNRAVHVIASIGGARVFPYTSSILQSSIAPSDNASQVGQVCQWKATFEATLRRRRPHRPITFGRRNEVRWVYLFHITVRLF